VCVLLEFIMLGAIKKRKEETAPGWLCVACTHVITSVRVKRKALREERKFEKEKNGD